MICLSRSLNWIKNVFWSHNNQAPVKIYWKSQEFTCANVCDFVLAQAYLFSALYTFKNTWGKADIVHDNMQTYFQRLYQC